MKFSVYLAAGSALVATGALSGCVNAPARNPMDPYESFNRSMFAFNNGVDQAILEPAARGYRAVTTPTIREGVGNFTSNLREPVTAANQVLQGKPVQAAGTAGRFVINSTVGLVGIFDVASTMGIQRTTEDFGQTLGVWGVESGPYLVLPFLGSTSPRDLTGMGVDAALNPINYAEFDGDDTLRIGSAVLGGLNAREGALEATDSMRNQIDPYTTVRRYYVRNRAAQIGNQQLSPNDIEIVPDYELDF
jgi:phospholipid-binding lipoprotein MlaA